MNRRRSPGAFALGIVFLSMSFAMRAPAQTAALSITSPANRATVMPGAALPITVNVAPGSYPNGIAVIGQGPLGAASVTTSTGATVNLVLAIPATVAPGLYAITAVGVNSTGTLVTSSPVHIDVERSDSPMALSVDPVVLTLRFVGDALPVTVLGSFSGGFLEVTQSSLLTMESANPRVATATNGLITAVGAGQTTINLTYGSLTAQIEVTVPMAMRGDLNGDGIIDKSDLNIITAALNTPANGSNDARDLNHDGVINALDARILVTLCTYSGCASQ
jgi:hypothetical protein